MLPLADRLREFLAPLPLDRRDAFTLTETLWPSTAAPDVARLLDARTIQERRASRNGALSWLRPYSRRRFVEYLQHALYHPDAVKQRSAADTLRAAGPEVREAATDYTRQVLEIERAEAAPRTFAIERCVQLLGMMGCAGAVETVASAVRHDRGTARVQAVVSAGDLAHLRPRDAVGLMAWVYDTAQQCPHDDDLMIAAIDACVCFRSQPAEVLRDALAERRRVPGDPVEQALGWARGVLADSLLPPRVVDLTAREGADVRTLPP